MLEFLCFLTILFYFIFYDQPNDSNTINQLYTILTLTLKNEK